VNPDSWDSAKQCVKGNGRAAKELNMFLETERLKVFQIYRQMELDEEPITSIALTARFLGVNTCKKTLLTLFEEHNQKCVKLIGKDFSRGTVSRYFATARYLKELICRLYKRDDLFMNEIKSDLLSQFDLYLKTEKNCEFNGAMKHLKNLKKIIGIALQNNWIKSDPFANYTFQYEKVETTFLTDRELSAILMKNFGCQRLENVRDTFVFCCFTGLAFSDVQQLRPEHIVTDNDGKMWIRKARQKTKQMANIPLLEIPLKIIEKYRENPQCERRGTLLPVLTNQKMNAYLKEIADVCGITKNITSHVSRHTFGTLLTISQGVPIETVSRMMGHTNIKTTQIYAKIMKEKISQDMEILSHKLESLEKQITERI
jgi:site-specific recombinase XerD